MRMRQQPRLGPSARQGHGGCLLVAKSALPQPAHRMFRQSSARKIYWALVAACLKAEAGRISTFSPRKRVRRDTHHADRRPWRRGASHAVTDYAVVETSERSSHGCVKPVTGLAHQMRAIRRISITRSSAIPIFHREKWELPGGLQKRTYSLRGGSLFRILAAADRRDPRHCRRTTCCQSWNLLGFSKQTVRSDRRTR